jgi:hypothetical protein
MATIVRGGQRQLVWSLRLGLVKNTMFVLACALVLVLAVEGRGYGAVTVSRSEMIGGHLRIEGTALPLRAITVDGVTMGTSAGDGRFRVERAGYVTPSDCTVVVNDGSATPVTTRLSGCTVATVPPPAEPSLSSLGLSRTSVVGGTVVTGTAILTSAAPPGGVVVTLSSLNTGAATVPPSVTVAGGSTTASFTVVTHPVPSSQPSVIIGTAGAASRNAVHTVTTSAASPPVSPLS